MTNNTYWELSRQRSSNVKRNLKKLGVAAIASLGIYFVGGEFMSRAKVAYNNYCDAQEKMESEGRQERISNLYKRLEDRSISIEEFSEQIKPYENVQKGE